MWKLLQPLITLCYRILAVRRILFIQDGLNFSELVVDSPGCFAIEVSVVDGIHGGSIAHDAGPSPARVALLVPVYRAVVGVTAVDVGRVVVGRGERLIASRIAGSSLIIAIR